MFEASSFHNAFLYDLTQKIYSHMTLVITHKKIVATEIDENVLEKLFGELEIKNESMSEGFRDSMK